MNLQTHHDKGSSEISQERKGFDTPLPVLADGCPAHPFEADHDARLCQSTRIYRAIKAVRLAIGSGLTEAEALWVLEYVRWRTERQG